MDSEDEPLRLMMLVLPPVIVAAGVFGLHLLPNDALRFLIAWILASFPVGVLIGHCVLSEEQNRRDCRCR
jgi:hypothetical protein